jgi:hypothetical protein
MKALFARVFFLTALCFPSVLSAQDLAGTIAAVLSPPARTELALQDMPGRRTMIDSPSKSSTSVQRVAASAPLARYNTAERTTVTAEMAVLGAIIGMGTAMVIHNLRYADVPVASRPPTPRRSIAIGGVVGGVSLGSLFWWGMGRQTQMDREAAR